MKFDCAILQELVDREIPVQITSKGYRVSGFYKSDTVLLVPVEGERDPEDTWSPRYIAHSRYGKTHPIADFRELLWLNASMWETYSRNNGGCSPDTHWEAALVEAGILEKKKVEYYTYSFVDHR